MRGTVYGIFNAVNGKVYVGSTAYLIKRWSDHRARLCKGTHRNPHLQAAWRKYGEACFQFCVLEYVPNLGDLIMVEQYYVDWFDAAEREFGYNQLPTVNSPLGTKLSLETRAKMSASRKGKPGHPLSETTKAKLSLANIGKPSPRKGKHLSDETKAKLSASLRGKPAHNKGKRTPAHVVEKLKEVHRGRPLSTEHRARISAALKGKQKSAETRAKLSAALKGKSPSTETRAKISATLKGKPLSEKAKAARKNRKKHISIGDK